MQNITRDIISDLYVLYSSGDATADSRKLVDEFLSQDPELAASLKESGGTIPILPAPLPPAHELKSSRPHQSVIGLLSCPQAQ